MGTEHIPVLVNEVIESLKPKRDGFYVDCTIGLGGHAAAILGACAPDGHLLGIDLDPEALAIARERLGEYKERLTLVHGNFAHLDRTLETYSITDVDGVLFDLGVSSLQLDRPDRGFSFGRPGPLDMRMNPNQSLSAADVLSQRSEERTCPHLHTLW